MKYNCILSFFFVCLLFVTSTSYAMEQNKYTVSQIIDIDISKVDSIKLEKKELKERYRLDINNTTSVDEFLEEFVELEVEAIDGPQKGRGASVVIRFSVGQMEYIYDSQEGFRLKDLANNKEIVSRYLIPYDKLARNIEIQQLKWLASKETVDEVISENKTFCKFTIGSNEAYLKNKEILVDSNPLVVPFIDNNTHQTMVPLRCVAEMFGCDVEWIAESNTVLLKERDTSIGFEIGEKDVSVQLKENIYKSDYIYKQPLWEKAFYLETAPYIINDRTFVPLRFISELFNFDVVWDGEKMDIYINEKEEKEYIQAYPFIEKDKEKIIIGLKAYSVSQIPIIRVFGNAQSIKFDVYDLDDKKMSIPKPYIPTEVIERIIYPEIENKFSTEFSKDNLDKGIYYSDIYFANNENILYRIFFDNQ